jgi:hypothetical protein
MLFSVQVMRSVCDLFTLEDAGFEFDNNLALPYPEMTGLSSPATDVTLAGLRALRDWRALEPKLPDPSSGLVGVVQDQPKVSFNQTESKVWEYSTGTVSLKEIATQLELPLDKVQQVVFRLMVIGLAEEVPMVDLMGEPILEEEATEENSSTQLSQSFMENLMGFLESHS